MQTETQTRETPPVRTPADRIDFDAAVEDFYQGLYQFGLSLTGSPAEAADLTQETYRVLLLKSDQIRDPGKLKSWLYTTLHRRFLGQRRHQTRFPKVELEEAEAELPTVRPRNLEQIDAARVVAALQTLEERFRAPLAMFYLQGLAYKEIADILDIPIGTVMSRLSRAKEQLRTRLQTATQPAPTPRTAARPRRAQPRKRQRPALLPTLPNLAPAAA